MALSRAFTARDFCAYKLEFSAPTIHNTVVGADVSIGPYG